MSHRNVLTLNATSLQCYQRQSLGVTPETYVGMARDLSTFVADFRPGWGENALFLYFSRSKIPGKDPRDRRAAAIEEMEMESFSCT